MSKIFTTFILLTGIFFTSLHADSKAELDGRILKSVGILEEVIENPSKGIPKNIFDKAHGIAIFPSVVKAGFIFGGMFGKGILLNKLDSGGWSNPTFISVGGGSFGLQIGAASVSLVLMIMNTNGVESLSNGNVTLGADIGIAAGPMGREASAKAGIKAGILSYSVSEGLFAGIALQGGLISSQEDNNKSYYGSDATPKTILFDSPKESSAAVKQLLNTLENY